MLGHPSHFKIDLPPTAVTALLVILYENGLNINNAINAIKKDTNHFPAEVTSFIVVWSSSSISDILNGSGSEIPLSKSGLSENGSCIIFK